MICSRNDPSIRYGICGKKTKSFPRISLGIRIRPVEQCHRPAKARKRDDFPLPKFIQLVNL